MPNYVFVIIRLKMSQNINALSGGLVCHHGISDDVYTLLVAWLNPTRPWWPAPLGIVAIWWTNVSSPTTDYI